MNKSTKVFAFVLLAIVLTVALMSSVNSGTGGLLAQAPKEIRTSEISSILNQIDRAVYQESELRGTLRDGTKFRANVPDIKSQAGADLSKRLTDAGVRWDAEPPSNFPAVITFIGYIIVPAALIMLAWWLFIRPAQMGGNQAMNFGRSRARRVGESGPKVTFEDVAGVEEAKEELYEIVDFLKNTKKYTSLGAKIPKGILLTGPPGVGKTHLARAIAGEAGVPFFHISGSDFVEMFVGVGAARVRDLFETAKAHRPSLIFVDEIDAVGRQRGAGLGGGHDEREQTLNQLLVEMDGFDPNSGVILIAATNRPDVLDPALLRPGRFDRQIVVDAPDANGREAILKIHAKGKPLAPSVKLDRVAKGTPGFTGADLANTLNEAALLAARRNKTKVGAEEVEEALDRVLIGPARRSREIVERDRTITAYHEAGHAVVGELLEHCDPVHKVTILPRGMALGLTWSLPEEEKVHISKNQLQDDITMSLGGLVAEEVVYGERWTGAVGDLKRVTRIARAMVCEYGMSDRLGTLAIGRRHGNPFLGRDYYEDRDYSEDVAKMIDEEVKEIVDRCHRRATQIVKENRSKLDSLVAALLERETIDREEFLAVMRGEALPKREDGGEQPPLPLENNKGSDLPSQPRLEPGPA